MRPAGISADRWGRLDRPGLLCCASRAAGGCWRRFPPSAYITTPCKTEPTSDRNRFARSYLTQRSCLTVILGYDEH